MPHCTLCGCNPARPCRSTGLGADGEEPAGEAPAQGVPLPAYACRILANGRCTRCQQCGQCGGPLDDRAQLVLVGRRKFRLCGTPQPCPRGEACDLHSDMDCGGSPPLSPASLGEPHCPATLPPCAITGTGDIGFEAMDEASRFGDLDTMGRTLDAWLQTLGWDPAEFADFRRNTAPLTT